MSISFPSNTRALLSRSSYSTELMEFAVWLGSVHYRPFIIHRHLLRVEQVLPRLQGPRCREEQLHRAFTVVGRGAPSRPRRFLATERVYRQYLLARGRLIETEAKGRYVGLCAAYQRYLQEQRGLTLSTREHHAYNVADFLKRGVGNRRRLHTVTLEDVERFVMLRSREVSRHTLQELVGHLRCFLRYCHDQGVVRRAIDAIETPRTYRGERPPQALDWSDVQTLLHSIDLRSKAGRRDHCILHLMAHYGLRPSEIVALRLDSIDWGVKVLRVSQRKTRSDLMLPLAPRTIRVLRDYLAHDRLAQGTLHPDLFLRSYGPTGPLLRTAIGDIFDKRTRLAKLQMGGHHVYRLRHTFAMQLLTRGVGVKAIGDLLGHHSLESTCAYLRLDIDMLRGVALEVPNAGTRLGGSHA